MEIEAIKEIYHRPLLQLMSEAQRVLATHHRVGEIEVCSLISFKTGGCSEDCAYCPQSARYQTGVKAEPLLSVEEVVAKGKAAKEQGARRICIGAAWKEVKEGKAFEIILECVRRLSAMEIEVCCTLGMMTEDQAKRLKEAGLYAYNHNLDTSPTFYKTIITTRSYDDRLRTLEQVEKAGLSLCCGGILGMGESEDDRIALLHTLHSRGAPPESIPLNFLVPPPGTPLEGRERIPIWEMVRMIATTRICFPFSKIRLATGRLERSIEEQALCFLAGANSIFGGDKLLTLPNPCHASDQKLFATLGLWKRE